MKQFLMLFRTGMLLVELSAFNFGRLILARYWVLYTGF